MTSAAPADGGARAPVVPGRVPSEPGFVASDVLRAVEARVTAVVPALVTLEREGREPGAALRAMVRHLGDTGVLSFVARTRADDGPISATELGLARERLAHGSPLMDLAFAMQGLGSHPITARGSDALRAQVLPKVIDGSWVAAFALTEPGAGSDLSRITTTARRDGDDYVLDGEKCFISNAPIADFMTVFAATGGDGSRRLSAFFVERATRGVEVDADHVLGDHPIGNVRFRSVRVPATSRIGDEGRGLSIALETLHLFRPTVGAAALGFAQRALDETVAHVTTRVQFDGPLAKLPVVQAHLADMACDVEAARLLVYRATSAIDRGATREEVARTGSMAKLVATEASQRVVDRAVQLHGGSGVRRSSVVARLYEDVRALRIYEGTSDVQRALIARELLRAHE